MDAERNPNAWPSGAGEMAERIRTHHWAATPLGPIETWPPSLKAVVDLLLPCGFPMVVLWGPELVQIYNDGCRELIGTKHPAGLGQPTRDCWPEVWHINAPIYERVLAGESVTFEDALYPISRHGVLEDAWFTLSYSPLRSESGAIAGVLVTALETTHRRRADEALRESEARYRALFNSIDEGYVLADVMFDERDRPVDIFIVDANPAATRMVGQGVIGSRLMDHDPGDEAFWYELLGRVARTGAGERLEQYAEPDAKWYDFYVLKVGGEKRSRRVAVVFQDITERKRAEAALRRSEARQSFLLRLGDTLRPLKDPRAIMAAAAEAVGRYLGVAATGYGEVNADEDTVVVHSEYNDGRMPSGIGWHRFSDYSEYFGSVLCAGQDLYVENVAADPRGPAGGSAASRAIDMRAVAIVPLHKGGRVVATFYAMHPTPRMWPEEERRLLREVAERTWAAVEWARVEAALRDSEERHRLIVEGARDYAIFTLDHQGQIDSWTPGAQAIFGWTTAEALGRPVAMTFTLEDQAAGVPHGELTTARTQGVAPDVRWHMCKDGGLVFIEGTTRALRDAEGRVRGYLKVGQDVTERKRLEAERERLMVAEAVALERGALLQRVVEAQEEERRRVAHEVHDSITQLAAAAALRLDDLAERLPAVLPNEDIQELERARDLARRAAAESRRLIAGLRPAALDDFGLAGAVCQEVEALRGEGWRVTVEDKELAGVRLAPEVEITLFRVAQEALTNVRKHTRPGRLHIRLRRMDQEVRLNVRDWGQGFDPVVVQAGAAGERVGLTGMRERLTRLGGQLTIRSSPGRGTTVSATLPLARSEKRA